MKTLPELPQSAISQRIQWVFKPTEYLKNCSQISPGIFQSVVNGGLVILSDPQALKTFLAAERRELSAPSKTNQILEPITGKSSIIATEGERHQQRRKLLMPPLHGEKLKSYGETIVKICHESVAGFQPQQAFRGRGLTQKIALEVINQTVFGLANSERAQKIKHLLTKITDSFNSPLTSALLFFPILQQDWGAWSPWGNFVQKRSRLDEMVFQEIAERRQHPTGDDILSLMIASRFEDGSQMDDQALRDELMALLFAGYETTASSMAWSLYWVLRCPEVKAKIVAELAQLPADADVMTVARLPYLSAVCQEILRICPVAIMTFTRQVEAPLTILGFPFAPGTFVMGCIYLLHQNPDLYPQPEQFRPERFLERSFAPYEYMPFGGGSRRCLGDALAMLEMKLGLASLIGNYEFALQNDRPERTCRRGVTLAPERQVPLTFIRPITATVPDVLKHSLG